MRVKLLSPSAGFLVGFAKKKFRELEQTRKRIGVPLLSKVIRVSDYTIKIYTSNWNNYVTINGSSVLPLMFLSGPSGTYVYNYLNNTSWKFSDATGQLAQGAEFLNFQETDRKLVTSGQKVTEDTLPGIYSAAGMLPGLNVGGFIVDGYKVWGTYENGWLPIAYLPETPILLRDEPVSLIAISQFFGLVHIEKTGAEGIVDMWNPAGTWNRVKNVSLTAINAAKPFESYAYVWKWVPRLWNPDIGNYLFLTQGFYYGYPGGGVYGPYQEAEVQFKCMLDCRGGSEPWGYAESLINYLPEETEGNPNPTAINGTRIFFMLGLWEPGNNHFYDEARGRIWFQHSYWDSCPAHEFMIDAADMLNHQLAFGDSAEILDVFWWSTADIQPDIFDDPMALPRPNQGVILAHKGNKNWRFYNYAGYLKLVKEGTGFIDHSVSKDGTEVAICYHKIEVDQPPEKKVYVYDIAIEETDEEGNDLPGRGKEIADNIVPGTWDISSVELIPRPKKDKEPSQKFPAPREYNQQLEIPATRDKGREIALFGMQHPWPPGNGHYASGWKMDIFGDKARIYRWEDECWKEAKYTMYQGSEDGQTPPYSEITNLIYAGGPNSRHGTAGGFSGSGSNLHPTVGGSSSMGGGATVQRMGIHFGQDLYGCLATSMNAKPPFDWSGDVEERGLFGSEDGCWKPIPGCSDVDGVPVGKVTLKDACDMRAEGVFSFDPLSISGPGDPEIGDSYGASGGTPGYNFSAEGLSVDSETGEVTDFSECADPGEIRTGTVRVSDSCGRTAEMEVRLPGGHWVLVHRGTEPFWADQKLVAEEIVGSTKTVKTYVPGGYWCIPEEYWFPGGCMGINVRCSEDSGEGDYWFGTGCGFEGSECEFCPPADRTDVPGLRGAYGSANKQSDEYAYRMANQIQYYGLIRMKHEPDHDDIYQWECP